MYVLIPTHAPAGSLPIEVGEPAPINEVLTAKFSDLNSLVMTLDEPWTDRERDPSYSGNQLKFKCLSRRLYTRRRKNCSQNTEDRWWERGFDEKRCGGKVDVVSPPSLSMGHGEACTHQLSSREEHSRHNRHGHDDVDKKGADDRHRWVVTSG